MPLHGHITTIPAQMTNEDCKTLGEQQLLTVICVFFCVLPHFILSMMVDVIVVLVQ